MCNFKRGGASIGLYYGTSLLSVGQNIQWLWRRTDFDFTIGQHPVSDESSLCSIPLRHTTLSHGDIKVLSTFMMNVDVLSTWEGREAVSLCCVNVCLHFGPMAVTQPAGPSLQVWTLWPEYMSRGRSGRRSLSLPLSSTNTSKFCTYLISLLECLVADLCLIVWLQKNVNQIMRSHFKKKNFFFIALLSVWLASVMFLCHMKNSLKGFFMHLS